MNIFKPYGCHKEKKYVHFIAEKYNREINKSFSSIKTLRENFVREMKWKCEFGENKEQCSIFGCLKKNVHIFLGWVKVCGIEISLGTFKCVL